VILVTLAVRDSQAHLSALWQVSGGRFATGEQRSSRPFRHRFELSRALA